MLHVAIGIAGSMLGHDIQPPQHRTVTGSKVTKAQFKKSLTEAVFVVTGYFKNGCDIAVPPLLALPVHHLIKYFFFHKFTNSTHKL